MTLHRDPRSFTIVGETSFAHPLDYSPHESFGDEHPDPVHWPSLCAGALLGFIAGLAAVAIPATLLAWWIA